MERIWLIFYIYGRGIFTSIQNVEQKIQITMLDYARKIERTRDTSLVLKSFVRTWSPSLFSWAKI